MLFAQSSVTPAFDPTAMIPVGFAGATLSPVRSALISAVVTDARARFVPHWIDAPRSTPEQVATWLEDD